MQKNCDQDLSEVAQSSHTGMRAGYGLQKVAIIFQAYTKSSLSKMVQHLWHIYTYSNDILACLSITNLTSIDENS